MSAEDPSPPPGLALERTTMAWVRTTLGLSVVVLLFLRFRNVYVMIPVLLGVAAAWTLGFVQWRRHPGRLLTFDAGSARFEREAALCVTVFVFLLALGGLLLVLL